MNIVSSPAVEQPARCWCGQTHLEDFSPDYWRCPECQTLVLRKMFGEEISRVLEDEMGLYGKNYYLQHLQEDYGYPDLETRARGDLPERCLHWLRTVLKFVPGPGARTLELGCGHGGFVAMQRWAGLDATGLELSPWLVGKAREWFGVPVLQGRLEDQELAPAAWDAVILMDVLEHLPDPRRTLGRAVSLLRSPGGFLLIQTPCYPAGWSYEALLAQNHPFLHQLKPQEHLYLFSEQAVERLCAELGVGQVRFEPAVFAHYDLFAVASASPLQERPLPERTEMLMAASPPARWTLALLDLGEVRDELAIRIAASAAECTALRQAAETQGAEITRLHAEVHQRLKEAAGFWPRLDAAENARNLLAARLEDLQRRFASVEADHAARLQVIEHQGTEITRLHAEVDHRLKEAAEFWPRLDAAENARNLLAAQLDDLRGHFERGETDRLARLQVIETQGAEIARLHAAADELWPRLDATENSRNLLAARLEDLQRQFTSVEADHAARLQVIETQGAEIARLHAAANELWPRLDAAENARNLLAAQLDDLRGHFERAEDDRAARLQVIESQGTEIGRLHTEVNHWRDESGELQPRLEQTLQERDRLTMGLAEARTDLEQTLQERDRLTAQLAETRTNFERSEAEGIARREIIENQEGAISRLQTQLAVTESERVALRKRKKTLDAHWTAWLLKRLRLWPLD